MSRINVLVFQLGSIGDTVVSIPALRAIRRHFGATARVTLLHEVRAGVLSTPADLLQGGPEVDRFLSYQAWSGSLAKARSAFVTWWRLLIYRFDVVVYLMPSERKHRQIERDVRFFRICGIRSLIGFEAFSPERLYPTGIDGRPSLVDHEAVCRLVRLRRAGIDVSIEAELRTPFLRLPETEVTNARQWLRAHRKFVDRKLVAVCPGSKQPANLWPVERFAEIARRLSSTGRHEVLVIGGSAESPLFGRILEVCGHALDSTGQFSVLGSASLLKEAAFTIGLDTGTTHLAAALGKKCVAIYGERDNPGRFEPLGDGHVVLRHKVACAGCRLVERACPVPGHPCMAGISIDQVWAAVEAVDASVSSAPL